MIGMFRKCSHLTSLDISNFETNNLEQADFFLTDCDSIEYLDLRKFNTLKVNATDLTFFPDKKNGVKIIYNSSIFNLSIPNDWEQEDIKNKINY